MNDSLEPHTREKITCALARSPHIHCVTSTLDPDARLERVLQLFWSRGYDNTSMQDIVTLLGLNRFTLYKSLGDKRHLLRLTLHRYREVTLASALSRLSEAHRGIKAIEQYLLEMIALARPSEHPRGCFFVNTAMEQAARDPRIERATQRHFDLVEQGMREALRGDPVARGWPTEEVEGRCRVFSLAAQGLMVQARLGRSPGELRGAAATLLGMGSCRGPVREPAPLAAADST